MLAMANPSMRLINRNQPHGWVCHGYHGHGIIGMAHSGIGNVLFEITRG